MKAISEKLTIEIDYVNGKGEESTRTISHISLSNEYGSGYISAYCHLKEEELTFKIKNIIDARISYEQMKEDVIKVQTPSNPRQESVNNSYIYKYDSSKPIYSLYGEKF